MRLVLVLTALLLTRGALAAPLIFPSSAGNLAVETVAGGLVHPWSLALLPERPHAGDRTSRPHAHRHARR